MKYVGFFLFLLFVTGCKDPVIQKKEKHNISDKSTMQQNYGRDGWQKPAAVINKLGDISKKTIVDIGAGTGFFTLRLVSKAKKVIAVDIDPTMLEIINSFKLNLNPELQEKLVTRLANADDPMLEDQEADVAIIINTIAYIDNRVEYLKKLRHKLKPNGQIMIVDFKSRHIPIDAPPRAFRIPLFEIEQQLSQAGFSNIASDDRTLDYQYIINAEKGHSDGGK